MPLYQIQSWNKRSAPRITVTYTTGDFHKAAEFMAREVNGAALEVCAWLPSGDVVHMLRDKCTEPWRVARGGRLRDPFGVDDSRD